jgi:hypothetical protein
LDAAGIAALADGRSDFRAFVAAALTARTRLVLSFAAGTDFAGDLAAPEAPRLVEATGGPEADDLERATSLAPLSR